MRVLRGLAAAALLAPVALFATSRAEAAPLGYCVGGPINVGYGYSGSATSCAIPFAGTYRIKAYGADGGDHPSSPNVSGGKGAAITASFLLQVGDILTILVGGQGQPGSTPNQTSDYIGGGGGGGSFVALQRGGADPAPLLIAGGGGGAGTNEAGLPGRAIEGNPGVPDGAGQNDGGAGGTNGSGGGGAPQAAGGAGGGGVTSSGGDSQTSGGGQSFAAGGAGGGALGAPGCSGADGGFGGGGAGGRSLCTPVLGAGGGGGGGYSGGGGGGWNSVYFGGAGGGGSSWYNLLYAVQPITAQAGGNIFGDGQVQIQWIATLDGTPVPEPGSLALFATALGFLAHRRARSRRRD
jgi:hypothetical protein